MPALSQASIAQILAAEEQARKDWEVSTFHGPYTIAALRAAFEHALAPGQDWKGAIRVLAESQAEADRLVAGIEYFVGGPTTVTPRTFLRNGRQVALLVIENAGYWSNIGA